MVEVFLAFAAELLELGTGHQAGSELEELDELLEVVGAGQYGSAALEEVVATELEELVVSGSP